MQQLVDTRRAQAHRRRDLSHGRAVELVQSGRVQPSRLVNHVYGLEDAATAMRAAATGDTGKTLVDVAGIAAERSSSFLREGSGMGAP